MKQKTRFQQQIIWTDHEKPIEYMILVEVDDETEIPIRTIIVRTPVPQRYLPALRCHIILN